MLSVSDIIKSVGQKNIIDLYNKTSNRYFNPEVVQKYIQEKLSVAHYLRLHETSNKKLIDIGTGAGWFPYICNLYGHTCIGTDLLGRPEYDPIYDFLNVDIREELVYAQKPFGLKDKVNYIVSLRSFFPNRPTVWEIEDWKYFFNDIKKNIKDDGGIYLGCNTGKKGKYKNPPHSHWGPKEVGHMFEKYHVQSDKKSRIKSNTIFLSFNNILTLTNS